MILIIKKYLKNRGIIARSTRKQCNYKEADWPSYKKEINVEIHLTTSFFVLQTLLITTTATLKSIILNSDLRFSTIFDSVLLRPTLSLPGYDPAPPHDHRIPTMDPKLEELTLLDQSQEVFEAYSKKKKIVKVVPSRPNRLTSLQLFANGTPLSPRIVNAAAATAMTAIASEKKKACTSLLPTSPALSLTSNLFESLSPGPETNSDTDESDGEEEDFNPAQPTKPTRPVKIPPIIVKSNES